MQESSKHTSMILKAIMVLVFCSWVAFVVVTVGLEVFILAVVLLTCASFLVVAWIVDVICRVVKLSLRLLGHTDYSKVASGAAPTTATLKSASPRQPAAARWPREDIGSGA